MRADAGREQGACRARRLLKALSVGEMDKLTMLNGLVQKLLAGVN